MINWKTIAPLLVSLTLAFVGSFILYQWVKTQTTPKEIVTVKADAVTIAVVALDLPWGTKLEKEMINQICELLEMSLINV